MFAIIRAIAIGLVFATAAAVALARGAVLTAAIFLLCLSWGMGARGHDAEAETAQVGWCTGPWTLGCEGSNYQKATIPIGEKIEDAVIVEPSAVGFKWFDYLSGPQGCLFVGTNGRDFPSLDGRRKAGFFVEGYAPIMGIAGGSCARFGITTHHGALPGY